MLSTTHLVPLPCNTRNQAIMISFEFFVARRISVLGRWTVSSEEMIVVVPVFCELVSLLQGIVTLPTTFNQPHRKFRCSDNR